MTFISATFVGAGTVSVGQGICFVFVGTFLATDKYGASQVDALTVIGTHLLIQLVSLLL
jgi:hypothetical protein